ncbi:MAG: hypothetical protein KAX04_03635, partial [Methanomicrobia archaeon]|nr:hypothetical protein [Methanomicrobia archaeon]
GPLTSFVSSLRMTQPFSLAHFSAGPFVSLMFPLEDVAALRPAPFLSGPINQPLSFFKKESGLSQRKTRLFKKVESIGKTWLYLLKTVLPKKKTIIYLQKIKRHIFCLTT